MRSLLERGRDLTETDFLAGVTIPVDKPVEWTSFDVVAKIRNALRKLYGIKKIKVGHSGTLDPFATGLLLICTGKATKSLNELTGLDKEYIGKMRFDGETPTYDHTSEVLRNYSTEHLTIESISRSAAKFKGVIRQEVPAFSAVKKEGKRLYQLARKGQSVDLPVREVVIHDFDIQDWDGQEASFAVKCGKGTYIRSLAHDLGKELTGGGYLTELRRTAIDRYTIDHAWPLMELINVIAKLERSTE